MTFYRYKQPRWRAAKRDEILWRTFKMYVNCGAWDRADVQGFMRWAKDKAESFLISELDRRMVFEPRAVMT